MKFCKNTNYEKTNQKLKVCDNCYCRIGVAPCDGKAHIRRAK